MKSHEDTEKDTAVAASTKPGDKPEGGRSRDATIAGQVLVWDLDDIEADEAPPELTPERKPGTGGGGVGLPLTPLNTAAAPSPANLDEAVPVNTGSKQIVSTQRKENPVMGKQLLKTRPAGDGPGKSPVPDSPVSGDKTVVSSTPSKPKAKLPKEAPAKKKPAADPEVQAKKPAEEDDPEARRKAVAKRKQARVAAKQEIHFPLNSPGSQARKSTRARRFLGRLFWMLLFLAYAAGVLGYFGVLAKDRFVSRAIFVVTRASGDAATATSVSLVMGANPGAQDAYSAIAYIRSVDMLKYLEEVQKFDLIGHFSQASDDFIYRLDPEAPLEDIMDFYQERVTAYYNDVEGIVTLEVEAFDQVYAQKMAAAILDQAEEYLNESNRKIAQEQMKFVAEDLELSESRLNDARALLLAFQNKNLIIDPQADIESRMELIQEIKKEMVFLQAERIKLIAQSPNSPRIQEIEATVEGLDSEIEREAKDLTGDNPEQLNQLLAEFSDINQTLEFALERYRQSLSVAEEVRIQSLQENRFLSVIEQPFVPEDSIRPRRGYLAASFLILGFMALQILRLSIRTVMEH